MELMVACNHLSPKFGTTYINGQPPAWVPPQPGEFTIGKHAPVLTRQMRMMRSNPSADIREANPQTVPPKLPPRQKKTNKISMFSDIKRKVSNFYQRKLDT